MNDAPRKDISCNCIAKSLHLAGKPRVVLFAARDILPGQQMLYDYGGHNLPWRKVSAQYMR